MKFDIIAHRGLWTQSGQQNSMEAFKNALGLGFGIETDLRDYNSEIVISHDIPTENSITFREFMLVVNQYSPQTLALNIKSDGLQELVKNTISGYSSFFCFDMSIPDSLGYKNMGITFYTRYSDIETHPVLLKDAAGVWFDRFSSNTLDIEALHKFLTQKKKLL